MYISSCLKSYFVFFLFCAFAFLCDKGAILRDDERDPRNEGGDGAL